MITAVDSSVLIDVFQRDSAFYTKSALFLRQCIGEGRLCICEIVWAELAAAFPSQDALEEKLNALHVEFSPLTKESAYLAGTKWTEYRMRGGTRKRVVADFLIASHAEKQCDRLLTRDRGFYRTCFNALPIIDPTD